MEEIGDFASPDIDGFGEARPGEEEVEELGWTQLLNRLKPASDGMDDLGVEENYRAFGRDEQVATRRVKLEHRIVPASGRVAHIDRVDEKAGCIVMRLELLTNALKSVGAEADHVERCFGIGQSSWRNLMRD